MNALEVSAFYPHIPSPQACTGAMCQMSQYFKDPYTFNPSRFDPTNKRSVAFFFVPHLGKGFICVFLLLLLLLLLLLFCCCCIVPVALFISFPQQAQSKCVLPLWYWTSLMHCKALCHGNTELNQ